jgi:soluble lytic murein transglycosylase-like protein
MKRNRLILLGLLLVVVLASLLLVRAAAQRLSSNDNVATTQPAMNSAAADSLNAMPNLALSPVFTDEVQYWRAYINLWANQYGIDANLIATLIQIESCGDPTVGSSAGAQGLFQVMPFHFAPEEDMLDVQTNARRGLNYLAGSLALSQGDVSLALAGYNGGYGVMYRNWAAETRAYVSWGSRIYADASAELETSAALADWLAAGGANLCRRARQSIGAF